MRALTVALALCACRDGAKRAPRDAGAAGGVRVIGCRVADRPLADAIATPAAPRSSRVRLGEMTITGDVERGAAERTLDRVIPTLEGCLRRGFDEMTPVEVTIGPTGAVVHTAAASDHQDFAECIVDVFEDTQFPPGQGVVQMMLEVTSTARPLPPPEPEAPSPWAGYAWEDDAPGAAVEAWIAEHVRIDPTECPTRARGSARATLAIRDGVVGAVEVLGLGDADTEDCLGEKLAALQLPPPPVPVAVTCDLVAGAPAPLRVTIRPDATETIARFAPTATGAEMRAALQAIEHEPHVVAIDDDAGHPILISDRVPRGAGAPETTGALHRLETIVLDDGLVARDLRARVEVLHAEGRDRVRLVVQPPP